MTKEKPSKPDHRLNTLLHAQEGMTHPTERDLSHGEEFDESVRAARLDDLTSPDLILHQMSKMTTGARSLGEAAEVLCEMFKECELVVLTLAGVASVGKLDFILAELIDRGLIGCVVSTGAVVTHGCSHEMGGKFYKIDQEEVNEDVDVALYNRGLNRVYDTVELEHSLEKVGDLVCEIMRRDWKEPTITSSELHCCMGKYLCKEYPREDGLLHASYRAEIPVIVPAFTDSEIGLSFARYLVEGDGKTYNGGGDRCTFDALGDFKCYASLVKEAFAKGPIGILTLGGGVPRNWAQQIGPFFDSLADRGVIELKKPVRFQYGVRICPEFREWGGLSGCTYSEGISWGKFVPTKEGGRYAEVYSDYTTIFPLLAAGVMERLGYLSNGDNKETAHKSKIIKAKIEEHVA